MEALVSAGHELLSLVGSLWVVVWVAGFVVMTFESARPRAEAGVSEQPSAWARVGAVAIAALPFLLFLHAFGAFILANQDSGVIGGEEMLPIVVLVAALGALVLIPAMLGHAIGRLSSELGVTLHRLSPVLGVGVLALALYVTWPNVFMVLNLYVLNRLS